MTSPGYYTVTPAAFAAQMQLLHDAGYTTISAAQFGGWLHGDALPPRPVLVTFDDGVEGVWRAADPILARYNQHAIAFVITGFVGAHQPYYMNWPELSAMSASGRWDIESHSHLGHVRFTINDRNEQGAFFTNRHYLAAEHIVETNEEFSTRIKKDLGQSISEITAHGLPAPRLFAYPFSENVGEPTLTKILAEAVHSLFDAAMLDSNGAAITTPADREAGTIRRIDVTAGVSLPQWVDRIEQSTPLVPGDGDPLQDRASWTDASGTPTALPIEERTVLIDPGPEGWKGLLYAKSRTAQWQDYAVQALLGGFERPGDGSTAGLRVLADTPQQVQVTAFAGGYEVRQGMGTAQHVVTRGTLPVGSAYSARIETRPDDVGVSVSGRQVANVSLATTPTGPPTGGIEMTGQREKVTAPTPLVRGLTITPI